MNLNPTKMFRHPAAVAKLAVVASTLLLACGHQSHQRAHPQPSAEALLSALEPHQQAVQRLNLQTRTTSWLGGDRVAATVLMLVDRAGRLRFEAEVSLKGTVAALATDGKTFQLLDLERNEFHEGPACPGNVARLVRIPLEPQMIAAILLGDAPVDASARLLTADWDAELGAERLELEITTPRGRKQRLRVLMRPRGSRDFIVVGVEGLAAPERGRNGWWRVRYEDHQKTGGVWMPNLIRFAEPGESFDDGVEIRVRDRRMNPEIPVESFTLEPPAGMPVEHLPCDEPM